MRPEMGNKQAQASIYALPYQPMSSMELNSSVILGMAVAMIVRSNATRKIDKYMPIMIVQNFRVFG